jgi:non-homologous end joining protein Ku
MPQRAHWKGWLKLSLVSCPIALYPAIAAAERVAFRQVNRETGNRLRQQLVDEVTGQVVQSHEKARGYEVGERQYLVVEDAELDQAREEARTRSFSLSRPAPVAAPEVPIPTAAKVGSRSAVAAVKREPAAAQPPPPPLTVTPRPIENNRTIIIDRFVPRAEIDTRYYDAPYYIAPRDEVGEEAFAVIREAMAAKGVVGLARVVLARRERPIVIDPFGNGLCGTTLRYAHEIRDANEYLAGIPDMDLPEELIAVAEQIIEAKLGSFDPGLLEDRYRTVLVEALKAKTAQSPARASAAVPSDRNVIDLMALLKRSMAQEKIAPSKGRGLRGDGQGALQAKPQRAAAAAHRTPTRRARPAKGR